MWRPQVSIVAIALAAGVASAKPHKSTKGAKHESIRASMKVIKSTKLDNMPGGWTWPPSRSMAEAAKACEARLDELGATWTHAASEGHIVDAMTTDQMFGGVAYIGYSKSAYKLDCQLALQLETFGPALYALGVREVHFGSIYRWTRVRVGGKTKNILSRHALGLAMDIVSFVDADGATHTVGRDYKSGDALLLAVESAVNASGKFRLLLTPKNDPISHKDHFHLEAAVDYD
jgi:hypothetical protein